MVEDDIEGEFDLSDEGLSRLDRLAASARKKLGRRKKAEPQNLAKDLLAGESKGKKKDTFKKLIESDLGTGKAGQAINFLKSPVSAIQGILTGPLPILGGILAAAQMVKFMASELTKKGGIFDRFFKDAADTLSNALRDKQVTADIKSGLSVQLILTTASGSQSPRDAYNTFEQFENNKEQFESDFAIRRTDGGS